MRANYIAMLEKIPKLIFISLKRPSLQNKYFLGVGISFSVAVASLMAATFLSKCLQVFPAANSTVLSLKDNCFIC